MIAMMMMMMTRLLLVKVVGCSGHWLSADFSIGSWIKGGWRAYWSAAGGFDHHNRDVEKHLGIYWSAAREQVVIITKNSRKKLLQSGLKCMQQYHVQKLECAFPILADLLAAARRISNLASLHFLRLSQTRRKIQDWKAQQQCERAKTHGGYWVQFG